MVLEMTVLFIKPSVISESCHFWIRFVSAKCCSSNVSGQMEACVLIHKRRQQVRYVSEPCRLNAPSHHLLDSCIVSGNEVKLPLCNIQTDRQFLCRIRGRGLVRTIVFSCNEISMFHSDLCTNERVTIDIFRAYGVGCGKRACQDWC